MVIGDHHARLWSRYALSSGAREFRRFICPVPRPGGGFINLVTQYNGKQVFGVGFGRV